MDEKLGNMDIFLREGNEHGIADQDGETKENGKKEQRNEDAGDDLDDVARKQAERYMIFC